MFKMLPKSILFGGAGVVVLGGFGIWFLGSHGENSGLGDSKIAQGEAWASDLGRTEKDRRITGKSVGTGVGKKRMDRNEIVEVGNRLRWELNPLRRRAALGQLLEGMNEENAMLVRE